MDFDLIFLSKNFLVDIFTTITFSSLDFFGILPDLFLFLCTFFLLIFFLFCHSFLKIQVSNRIFKQMFYRNGLAFSLWSVFLTIFLQWEQFGLANFFYMQDLLKVSELIVFIKIIILYFLIFFFFLSLSITRVNLLVSVKYQLDRLNSFEFSLLILYSVIAMFFLVQSNDLVGMYLAIEFQALCFFILAAWKRCNDFSLEAGLKYFFLGVFASCFLLLGISLMYLSIGVTNFEDLSLVFGENLIFKTVSNWFFLVDKGSSFLFLSGLLFLSVGFLFKLGSAPFHQWLPDVYEGSLVIVTCFFSIFPKLSLTLFLIRFYIIVLYGCWDFWSILFSFCAIFCFLVGVLGSLAQLKIKRFLAYASIVQVGLILTSFCAFSRVGVFSCLLFLIIYVLMVLGIFSVLFSSRDYNLGFRLQYLSDFRFFIWFNPILCLVLVLILFSFAGVPPFAGFFTKMFVLLASVQSGLFFLSIILLVFNVVGCFYYISFIKILFFESLNQRDSFFGIGLSSKLGWFSLIPVTRECSIVLTFVFFIIAFYSFLGGCFFDIISFLSYKSLI